MHGFTLGDTGPYWQDILMQAHMTSSISVIENTTLTETEMSESDYLFLVGQMDQSSSHYSHKSASQ